jgi:hypothetical protein
MSPACDRAMAQTRNGCDRGLSVVGSPSFVNHQRMVTSRPTASVERPQRQRRHTSLTNSRLPEIAGCAQVAVPATDRGIQAGVIAQAGPFVHGDLAHPGREDVLLGLVVHRSAEDADDIASRPLESSTTTSSRRSAASR